MPPKFREFFNQRNGRPWPKLGDLAPPGVDWAFLINETMADYLDLIVAKTIGEKLED